MEALEETTDILAKQADTDLNRKLDFGLANNEAKEVVSEAKKRVRNNPDNDILEALSSAKKRVRFKPKDIQCLLMTKTPKVGEKRNQSKKGSKKTATIKTETEPENKRFKHVESKEKASAVAAKKEKKAVKAAAAKEVKIKTSIKLETETLKRK